MVVEELSPAWAQERKEVLEVGRGARRSAKCRRIERSSPCREEKDARETAADLEPTRPKVSVRHTVAGDVKGWTEKECREPRAAGGACRSARRNVEGNDHGAYLPECPRPSAESGSIRDDEYRRLMEDAARDVLEFIGDQGKTVEQVSERFPGFDIQRLVRAELVRPRRTNPGKALPRPGAAAPDHTFYVLTSRGAEAIGLEQHTLHSD